MYENIKAVANAFALEGEITDITAITDGNINSTFKLRTEKTDYLLQKINTFVFKNPDELMQNIVAVTEFLKDKIRKNGGDEKRETLTVIRTKDGKSFFTAENGECWRCYLFVKDTYALNSIENEEIFSATGRAFGKFQLLLSDFPSEILFETIPDFHNTRKRYLSLEEAVSLDRAGRAKEVEREIEFIRKRKADTCVLTDMISENGLPVRVTHNDTKLNNILFDKATNEGICVIDLDTVMPGLSLYDFGDCVRYGASRAKEDESDLSLVSLDMGLFRAYSRGYLDSVGDCLTRNEKQLLPFSVKLMSLELAIRFLTDYLNGDEYFKINYPLHNLVRTRVQIKLTEDIETKLPEMQEFIDSL